MIIWDNFVYDVTKVLAFFNRVPVKEDDFFSSVAYEADLEALIDDDTDTPQRSVLVAKCSNLVLGG